MASGNTLASESSSSPRVITGSISTAGMELSEDYTCVITHGPNPRMTHIFDDYIVESSCDDLLVASQGKATFLSFCHSCKKGLAQGNDTFMYRGDKAFCSQECRYKGMLSDESAGEFSSDH
ncbi:unnamed protein product [Spirodela intermedia]|uniref:FLZ-type domain-containing protein n=1 Tax=Spirodela intermedia TaxID=51605 RepID=A0A7I8L1Y3_SPIIN|nr:unnamed protein product [Spirodela intermedia]